MGYFNDKNFQERMLAFLVGDFRFLRKFTGIITPMDFTATPESGAEGWARETVARLALHWWKKYREPLGGLLRTEALDYIRVNRHKLGKKYSQALLDLGERLSDPALRTASGAMEEKIRSYKSRQTMRNAIEEYIALQQKGELTAETFLRIARKSTQKLKDTVEVEDYLENLEGRIRQRDKEKDRKFPFLFIDPLDRAIPTIPRGQIGLWLGKYKVGKSTALIHTAQAYAMQGFNVLYFTLEDPKIVVTSRMDASLTGVRMTRLVARADLLRRRWERVRDELKAKIKVVDATGGGWSVERMAEVWENQRLKGFTADLVVIDYDDKIKPPVQYKGDGAVRFASHDNYEEMTNWAARDQLWIWTAAQAKRVKDRVIVTGDDAAEDISKLRVVGLCLGIGFSPKDLNLGTDGRYINVAAHKFGGTGGWPIVCDLERATFFDRERSREALSQWQGLKPKAGVE
jgi:KaiC/GvpD/RAD55 family RecA-like ATPase